MRIFHLFYLDCAGIAATRRKRNTEENTRDCWMRHPYEGNAAVFNIASDCRFYKAAFHTEPNKTVSIFPVDGSIGSNICTVTGFSKFCLILIKCAN